MVEAWKKTSGHDRTSQDSLRRILREALELEARLSAKGGASAPPQREPLGGLRLVQDLDSFLQVALLRLDLVFEKDPARRRKLERLEGLLVAMEEMDWPAVPAGHRTLPPDPATVARTFEELVSGDLRLSGGHPFNAFKVWKAGPGSPRGSGS